MMANRGGSFPQPNGLVEGEKMAVKFFSHFFLGVSFIFLENDFVGGLL